MNSFILMVIVYTLSASLLAGLMNVFQLYMDNRNEILDIESWHEIKEENSNALCTTRKERIFR